VKSQYITELSSVEHANSTGASFTALYTADYYKEKTFFSLLIMRFYRKSSSAPLACIF